MLWYSWFFIGRMADYIEILLIKEIKRSGVRFPTLVMDRSLGQASHPAVPLVTQQWWVPGARIQGWIDMCWLRLCGSAVLGGQESAEHACKYGYQTINWYLYLLSHFFNIPITILHLNLAADTLLQQNCYNNSLLHFNNNNKKINNTREILA